MTIDCYEINGELNLAACDFEHALEASRSSGGKIWFDVQGAENAELEVLLEKLDVTHLARRLCLDARERPGFYPLNSFVYMVIPVEAAAADLEYITMLCRENLLLTIRNLRDTRLQNITTVQESDGWLPNRSIEGLVSSIMMILSLECMQRLSDMRESVTVLEKRMDRTPELVSMSEISERRSRLLKLEAVISGQLPTFETLLATEKSFFNVDAAREYLISALSNLKAADRSVHWLEGRLHVVRSIFEMRSQDKMNRRLGRLTVLSAIFMPITFLAGVWGMNFEYMPVLSLRYGYAIGIGSMFFIGAGMYLYFRSKGWFE